MASTQIINCIACKEPVRPRQQGLQTNLKKTAPLGATGLLRGATKSEKVMINKNLVLFVLVFFN